MVKYNYWGALFLCVQLIAIVRNLSSDYFSFFWYCDFSAGIFALLFFLRLDQGVKGLLNIGLFGQLGYTLIFAYHLITGNTLFGFVFGFESGWISAATLLIHLSTLLVFIAEYKIKPSKGALWYSLIFLILIYIVVLTFTSPDPSIAANYNFIYYSRLLSPYIPYYTVFWIPIAFILIVLPTYFFQKWVYNRINN